MKTSGFQFPDLFQQKEWKLLNNKLSDSLHLGLVSFFTLTKYTVKHLIILY